MNERIDVDREADQVDRVIDEVVGAMMSASPHPGFGDRVTARLLRDDSRSGRHLGWPRWVLAGSAALALCVAALAAYLALAPSSQPPTRDMAASPIRQSTPAAGTATATRDTDRNVPASRTDAGTASLQANLHAPPASPTRQARANPWAERKPRRPATAGEVARTDGPPPLEVPRLGRPDPVSIDAIDVGWIGAQDLAIAPLEVDDDRGSGKR